VFSPYNRHFPFDVARLRRWVFPIKNTLNKEAGKHNNIITNNPIPISHASPCSAAAARLSPRWKELRNIFLLYSHSKILGCWLQPSPLQVCLHGSSLHLHVPELSSLIHISYFPLHAELLRGRSLQFLSSIPLHPQESPAPRSLPINTEGANPLQAISNPIKTEKDFSEIPFFIFLPFLLNILVFPAPKQFCRVQK
jgi:hypothetical protein